MEFEEELDPSLARILVMRDGRVIVGVFESEEFHLITTWTRKLKNAHIVMLNSGHNLSSQHLQEIFENLLSGVKIYPIGDIEIFGDSVSFAMQCDAEKWELT